MTRHLMAPDRARFSVANLRIFAITSFTRDLRHEPDGFSPQPARARLDQRFFEGIDLRAALADWSDRLQLMGPVA